MAGDTELQQLAKTDRNPIQETRYQELLKQQKSSQPQLQTFQMPDFASILKQQEQARLAKEAEAKTAEEGFLGRFRSFIGGQEGLPIMAERIGKELGLPGLRETAFGLTQNLKGLPRAITETGRAASVNADRLKRAIAERAGQLAPVAQEAISQQQFGEAELGRRLGFEQTQQQKELLPFQTEAGLMSDRVAREITGFTTGQTRELDAILAKMNAGITLQRDEAARAHDLALKEAEFENQKILLAEKAKYETPTSNLVTLGEGQALFDPITGQVRYKNPKTFSGGGGEDSY